LDPIPEVSAVGEYFISKEIWMPSPPGSVDADPADPGDLGPVRPAAEQGPDKSLGARLTVGDTEPLTHYVARALRKQILDGELVPGQRIVQDAVANQLGTSRIPVREALRELASEGLVLIEPDVGARVRSLDSAELLEVYMMREALEPLAVLHAVEHLTDGQLHEMGQLLTESEICASANDIPGYHHFDRLFHYALFEAAGLSRLQRVIHGLWNTAYQYQRVYARLPQNLIASTSEHRLILDAVERKASEDAGQLHLLHIRRTRHALVRHPEFFKGSTSPADKRPDTGLGDPNNSTPANKKRVRGGTSK
jgi:DNA-binding GntR family transcriptional regulator